MVVLLLKNNNCLLVGLTLAILFSFIFVGKMCVFVSRPMKIVTFLRKNDYTPKRVVDFPLEKDTFRNKIMEIVEDFDEKSYNNNGKPWKSSRILFVNPICFHFVFVLFIILSTLFFVLFSFCHLFCFVHVLFIVFVLFSYFLLSFVLFCFVFVCSFCHCCCHCCCHFLWFVVSWF